MTRWLVVTLAAPFASFGEEAGNAQRGTADRPTRSALVGLAGAALGIRRADAEAQTALAASLAVASWTLDAGRLLSDFHTYQSLPNARGGRATRALALASANELVTSITRREYRSDVLYFAAYRETEAASVSLDKLSAAFAQPVFSLYLGRKSCPVSRPLNPVVVDAPNAATAFRVYARRDARLALPSGTRGTLATEAREDLGETDAPHRVHLRVDDPGDRVVWQFSSRREYVRGLALDSASATSGEDLT
ncbi:type I-E CRISPR-associated protein Cas5/CasD [Breoghania sp.]|uniref:type I-E CRISPR-associated protein Cas5/CasD n=1 Tax=Breoghania sp. TaxID=2065378 RepID=UPI002AAC2239|nr:type I-E CRISPR-associated protein Cas5/CasD [Breoghania sp.]